MREMSVNGPRFWRMSGELKSLVGSVCGKCGEKQFPPRLGGACSDCGTTFTNGSNGDIYHSSLPSKNPEVIEYEFESAIEASTI